MTELIQVRPCCILTLLLLNVGYGKASSDTLDTLMADFWESQMRNNPTRSTYRGMYKYNDLMESFAVEKFDEDRNQTELFLTRLKAINRNDLDAAGKVNYDTLNDSLTTFLEGSKWARYGALTPINFLGGIHIYYAPYMATTSARGDFYNYIARLHAVRTQIKMMSSRAIRNCTVRFVDEIIASCRLAIQLNRTVHNVSMARVPEQIDQLLHDNPVNSSRFEVFGEKLDNSSIVNVTEREQIRELGRLAVIAYMDALRVLKKFVIDEYMPNTRQEYGVYAWDPTNEYYKACLKWHLSFEMDPDDVHNIGLQEVNKITTAMHQTMAKLGFQGTVNEFFASLKDDSRFYSNDTIKILDEYKNVVFDRISPKLPTLFKNIPNVPLVVAASSTDGLGGGYSSATETSPGYFTINLFRPLEVPFFEMMALSLHEANPGHHLQHSYSLNAHLPEFRKDPLLSFYNVPNWFPFYSAYTEGWALYSEYLGEEMGSYKDDYEMMGRYSYDILRAVRLVVDTGLHYKKWSRASAIEYLRNHTAMGPGSAANEIDRYITWPGQACAYKLGEIRIRDLRKEAETELGSKFDIKDFHSLILDNGALPMNMLETMTKDWIANMKSTQSSAAITSLPVSVLQMFVILFSIFKVL